VWDTVGALGIPLSALQWLNSAEYGFHDTQLSKIVDNAFHALAIDEHRIDFQATLWSDVPDPGQRVEQTWFVGAHGDVGGGDPSALLSDIALSWMVEKAMSVGLVLDPGKLPTILDSNKQGPIFDSYGQFMYGLYAETHALYLRKLGDSGSNTESLHPSALGRLGYKPQNPGYAELLGP